MRLLHVAPLVLLAACASPAPGARTAVTLTHLGVAGWLLSDGTRSVLVDPHLSRPALGDGVPALPDEQAIARLAPARADLILVGHSHVDHALDAPAIALRTGAQVLGSLSTANLARASGVPAAQIIPVQGGEDYAFDGFSVRVIPALHGALDDKHTCGAGEFIARDVVLPMPMQGYGEGGTFHYLVRLGGHEVLFIGSANFIERELQGLRPDVAVVATGLRDEIHDYTRRLMGALGAPPLVLANHFDDWRAPLGTPLSAGRLADLQAFAREVRACAPATRVLVPVPLQPIGL